MSTRGIIRLHSQQIALAEPATGANPQDGRCLHHGCREGCTGLHPASSVAGDDSGCVGYVLKLSRKLNSFKCNADRGYFELFGGSRLPRGVRGRADEDDRCGDRENNHSYRFQA